MSLTESRVALTASLEDYLETVYEMVGEQSFARVKDIAKKRGVRAGSVSPAMRRLAELGLIRYERREYIALTPEGEQEARRILARHQLLARFLTDILEVPAELSDADACAMEHGLSGEAMDRLVRLFEFVEESEHGKKLVARFHEYATRKRGEQTATRKLADADKSVCDLVPGERGRVVRVQGHGAIRQRLLDMGILPEVAVEVERVAPLGDPIWIKLQGFQISLRRKEAAAVIIAPLAV
jgi:DtxR family Mn-dependent transcriptional regulator